MIFFFFKEKKDISHVFLLQVFLFLNLFLYIFLAVLGLSFCARPFSSCGERGPLTIAASCCGAQAPDVQVQ